MTTNAKATAAVTLLRRAMARLVAGGHIGARAAAIQVEMATTEAEAVLGLVDRQIANRIAARDLDGDDEPDELDDDEEGDDDEPDDDEDEEPEA